MCCFCVKYPKIGNGRIRHFLSPMLVHSSQHRIIVVSVGKWKLSVSKQKHALQLDKSAAAGVETSACITGRLTAAARALTPAAGPGRGGGCKSAALPRTTAATGLHHRPSQHYHIRKSLHESIIHVLHVPAYEGR